MDVEDKVGDLEFIGNKAGLKLFYNAKANSSLATEVQSFETAMIDKKTVAVERHKLEKEIEKRRKGEAKKPIEMTSKKNSKYDYLFEEPEKELRSEKVRQTLFHSKINISDSSISN